MVHRSHSLQASFRIALLAMTVIIPCCRDAHEQGIPSLVDAYKTLRERPIAARLSAFPHLPRRVTRGAKRDTGDLTLASAAYGVLAGSGGSLPERYSRAVAQLFVGRDVEAIEALTDITSKDPADVAAWSDLAAAQLELGLRSDDAYAIARGVAAADRALQKEPSSREALFNRAACLESLGLDEAATRAWARYLAVDSNSDWAVEARERRSSLQKANAHARWSEARPELERAAADHRRDDVERLVRLFPQEARSWGESEYLGRWGEACLDGRDADARESLAIADAIAAAVEAFRGERLLRDSVEAAKGRTPRRAARAHVAYRRARLLIRDREPMHALQLLAEAEEGFRAAGSPMELVAAVYRAGALFDTHRAAEAVAVLRSLESRGAASYKALRGLAAWQHAQLDARRGAAYEALQTNAAALALFDDLGERDNALRVLNNRAALLSNLGRADEAWRLRRRLFAGASRSDRPEVLEAALHAAGLDEIAAEHDEVAWTLLNIQLAAASESPVRRFEAMLYRTFAAARSKLLSPRDLADLEQVAETIRDEELRDDALDELRFVQALLDRERDPSAAVEVLTQSIDYREREHRASRARTFLERGRAYRSLGRPLDAARDFGRALAILEAARSEIVSRDLRDAFFASAADVCTELVDSQVALQAVGDAFLAAERCRGRSLTDGMQGVRIEAAAFRANEIRSKLAPNELLLHYTALPDHLVVFEVSRESLGMRITRSSRETLDRQVARLLQTLAASDAQSTSAALRELYTLLVAPSNAAIARAERIIIVTDDALARLPFAALIDPASGRYVVENHVVIMAASARAYVVPPPLLPRHDDLRVTVVADPAFDSQSVYALPRLLAARAEALELANIHPGATLLVDRDATPERFLKALVDSDLVHVAAHAIVGARDWRTSVLVLAPGADDGLLYLPIIRDQRLRRCRLIVLAGCQTAVPGGGKGSLRSFALAFLAAGSRGVIASLWDVDDAATRRFSAELHRLIRAGATPAAALRETQLAMVRSPNPSENAPHVWGAFQFYGFDEPTAGRRPKKED